MKLHYQQIGQGPDVIVIHGLFGSLENLNVISKHLSSDYTVTSVDLRNHGLSAHSTEMSYSLMAQDIIDLMDDLNIEHAHFIGHSMGAKVAMQCGLNFAPRVSKLVIMDIAPVTYQERRHDEIFSALQSVSQHSINDRKQADLLLAEYIDEPGVRQFLLKSLKKTEQGMQWKFNHTVLQQEYANILTAPTGTPYSGSTLVLKGSQSPYIDSSHRPAFLALFPNCQAKVIQGAGHWLHAEKPSAVNIAITGFLLS